MIIDSEIESLLGLYTVYHLYTVYKFTMYIYKNRTCINEAVNFSVFVVVYMAP